MKSTLTKKDDDTIELTITIPWLDIEKTWDTVIDEAVKTISLPGFRKGKAPKKLAEKQLDPEKIQEEVLKALLPKYYTEAVKEHDIKPVMNPKIHVNKLDAQKDWEFTATTAEAPKIELGEYKKAVQAVTAKSKIIIPGKEVTTPKFEDIVKALLDGVQGTIPEILVEQEADKLLAQMLDEVKRLGLSLDQYLASTGRTADQIRAEYMERARNDMRLEFALQKIAEVERLTVDEKEIEETIQKAKTDAERQSLESNRYMLAGVLRQQKTLDFLKNL